MDDGDAYRIGFHKVRSTFSYDAGYEYVGENFDVNATGFTTGTGYWESWAGTHKTWLMNSSFSRIGMGGNFWYSELNTGEVIGRNVHADVGATMNSGLYFGINGSYSGETFDPYEGPEGRNYGDRASFHAYAGTNQFDDYYVSVGGGGGGYDSEGTFRSLNATVRMKPSSALELRLSGNWFSTFDTENYNWGEMAWDLRNTDWKSLVFRANYIFDPDVNLRLFSQYSRFRMDYGLSPESEGSEITANILFTWQYLPGSMFYFLVENRFEEQEDGGFGEPDMGAYAKLTWFLPI